jgi:hypothetical protein
MISLPSSSALPLRSIRATAARSSKRPPSYGHEIGDGIVAPAAREAQARYLRPAERARGHRHVPRWSSRRRNGIRASAEG